MKLIVRFPKGRLFTSFDVTSDFLTRLKHYLFKKGYNFQYDVLFDDVRLTLFSKSAYTDVVIWLDLETSPSLFDFALDCEVDSVPLEGIGLRIAYKNS